MPEKIYLVGWDADKTMYRGYITTMAAKYSTCDQNPIIEQAIQDGLFTREDMEAWVEKFNKGRLVESVYDASLMATAFMNSRSSINKL